MHINSSPLNFPIVVAAACLLGAIYTAAPAQARDLVGTQVTAKAQLVCDASTGAISSKRPSNRLAKSRSADVKEAVASSMLTSHGEGTDAARRAEFARRLFWVMLSMR
jgi:hypothetical protein